MNMPFRKANETLHLEWVLNPAFWSCLKGDSIRSRGGGATIGAEIVCYELSWDAKCFSSLFQYYFLRVPYTPKCQLGQEFCTITLYLLGMRLAVNYDWPLIGIFWRVSSGKVHQKKCLKVTPPSCIAFASICSLGATLHGGLLGHFGVRRDFRQSQSMLGCGTGNPLTLWRKNGIDGSQMLGMQTYQLCG